MEFLSNNRRKKILIIILSVLILIGLLSLYYYIRYRATHIKTDNAYIEGHIHVISSRVSGIVKAVYVNDNQRVKRGENLLELDPVDYEVQMKKALSGVDTEREKLREINEKIESARIQLNESVLRVEAAKAILSLKEANLRQAEIDLKRARSLYEKEAISRERLEKAETAYSIALEEVNVARQELLQAEKNLELQKSLLKQVEASRSTQLSLLRQKETIFEEARLNHSYTKIYSPSDGYITKKSVEAGNFVRPGQPLMAVVSLDDIWIVANYKETQLEKIRPGQKVKIKVDAYPGKVFWGRVDSIMSGTGSVFSLFPPENATGNWVKVVQRIPVKIILEKGNYSEHVLRVGMSVVSTILVDEE